MAKVGSFFEKDANFSILAGDLRKGRILLILSGKNAEDSLIPNHLLPYTCDMRCISETGSLGQIGCPKNRINVYSFF